MPALAKCKACKASIYWTVTRNGKRMPVDRDPHPEGLVLVWDHGGVLQSRTLSVWEAGGSSDPLRQSHFVTCTNPKGLRAKPKRGGKGRVRR